MTLGLAALASCAAPLSPPSPAAVFGRALPSRVAVRIVTDEGASRCALEPARAPRAAAMVAGLARGGFAWRDPRGEVTTRALYRDVPFHRVISGVLAQGGCPRGDGTGHPGYRVPLEAHGDDGVRLAAPGVWFTATYTPPPMRRDPAPPPPGHVVGSQFVVGLTSMAHLAGRVTVLGRCDDLDVWRRVAARPPERPARMLRMEVTP